MLAIGVAQRPFRRHPVAYQLLEHGEVREALLLLARPHGLAVEAHVEHATGAGDQRDLTQFGRERGQQLLRGPPGTQQPPALGAVLDLQTRCPHAWVLTEVPARVASVPQLASSCNASADAVAGSAW